MLPLRYRIVLKISLATAFMNNPDELFGVEIIPYLFYKRNNDEKGTLGCDIISSYEYLVHRNAKNSLPKRMLVGDIHTAYIQWNLHS
jgi:hypothetical protein